MRSTAWLGATLLLAACAGTNEYAGVARSDNMQSLVACAADALRDEGFTITDRNDEAGLLNADYTGTRDTDGPAWIETRIQPDGVGRYTINVEASDDAVARDAATEIVEECRTGI